MKAGIISISTMIMVSGFFCADLHAGTIDKISADIFKIQDACEEVNLYTVQHTPAENEQYIDDIVKKIEKNITSIRSNWQKLDENDPLKISVKDYIDRWERLSIRNSLLSSDGQFPSDTGYIASLLPPRKRWRTLFPIFKA